ncbi:phospholipid/cholesterol/gamma-HCH transport system substrate-binding protein [Desulfatibacillum alkenivorans DSM 16219]|jgi:phospholipid/cholesterol/gamma-HCH transport system substrate-binding protein|uniref:Phospholipid/cholesterol/gamma-HCH transport system substrate-binding protein n=1 Tax=Desulfatibacillum alkenivorans DSM 16219 TaxID=1121393 RepID=A0A1M6GUI2_9BACT|nr:MlaD family protein [Desulfatibacillum alkenivorans]SHJ13616.1 phospholipid/cholesterol/gamma-HCH transport system substrate-binding protein [Desulfatibacillum alkenivorans DSM 16219]
MASVQTKFMVGLFLIVGVALTVVVVIWVGMSGYLEKGVNYVMYFDESVQGLDQDSTVKYRGVPIGSVQSIEVAADGKLVEVVVKIRKGDIPEEPVFAQLKSVGITGIMFIELDLDPAPSALKQDFSFEPPYPVIPTRLSGINQIFRNVETMFSRFEQMDVEGVIVRLQRDLDSLDKVIKNTDTEAISSSIVESLDRLNNILDPERWDAILASVQQVGPEVEETVGDARAMFNRAESALGRLDGLLLQNQENLALAMDALRETMEAAASMVKEGENLVAGTDDKFSHLQQHLLVSVQNLEKATENLNRLLDSLAQDPAQILLGQPPAPRSVGNGGGSVR